MAFPRQREDTGPCPRLNSVLKQLPSLPQSVVITAVPRASLPEAPNAGWSPAFWTLRANSSQDFMPIISVVLPPAASQEEPEERQCPWAVTGSGEGTDWQQSPQGPRSPVLGCGGVLLNITGSQQKPSGAKTQPRVHKGGMACLPSLRGVP